LRGSFFITRLPEFALGIALGIAFAESPARTARVLRSPAGLGVAGAALALGFPLSFTLAGMSVAPFLIGAGIFVLGYAATESGRAGGARLARAALVRALSRSSRARRAAAEAGSFERDA
jgi:hypothetical protein